MILTNNSKKFIGLAIIAHLLAVYFSTGFFNLDEQTQVLQLVGYKLGNYDVSYLSDQYTLAIRSWFHPAIYLWCSKLLLTVSTFNPFVHAFFYRLLSSLLGMFSLFVLYKTFEDEIKEVHAEELFIFITANLWFFPFLHARPANENICAIFFIFGLYYLKKHKRSADFFIAGLFLALSFIVRFQMAVMVASVVLWFFIFKKFDYKKYFYNYFYLLLGFFITLAVSTSYDTYMYGHFTFAPYNYFYVNIIKKYASSFGVTPPYQYFIYCFRECLPPLALMVIASFVTLWIKFPKHLLTWITLPFFILHSLIGHKEFRFLFPMAPFLPLIIIFVLHSLDWQHKKNVRTWFLVINLPLLVYFSFTPAASSSRFFKYLYDRKNPVSVVHVFSFYEDNSKFYLKNDINYTLIRENEVPEKMKVNGPIYFLTKNLVEQELVLKYNECQVGFSLYPQWIYKIDFIKKRRTFRSWSFVECSK